MNEPNYIRTNDGRIVEIIPAPAVILRNLKPDTLQTTVEPETDHSPASMIANSGNIVRRDVFCTYQTVAGPGWDK